MLMDYLGKYLKAVEALAPFAASYGYVGVLVGVALTLSFAFFGYKLLRLFLFLFGFVLGLALGGSCAIALGADDKVIVIASLVIGVLVATALSFVYRAGLFILFSAAGFYLASRLLPFVYKGAYDKLIMAGIALLLGILSTALGKYLLIAISSFAGGIAASSITCAYILTQVGQLNDPNMAALIALGAGLVLSLPALTFQISAAQEGE